MMDLRHGADHAPIGVVQEQPSHQFGQRPPRLSRQVRPFRGMARGAVRVAEEFHLTWRAPMVAYGPALCRWCRTRRCFPRHEPDLSTLSHADKDALIRSLLPLVGQLDAALARIAEWEKQLAAFERPPKNPDNSSLPPSKGQKPDRPAGDKPPRKSRPGIGRALEPSPDRIVDAKLDACSHCAAVFPVEQQTPQQVYDRIELPPIKPDVTRVRLFGGSCPCCGARAIAAAPSGLEPGSPFGQSIAALVVYLHYAHAIGLERLAALMGEMFALSISEGAISNMLARARDPLLAAAAAIRETVTASRVVCSDETSVRVSGKTWWEWVFVGTLAVLHIIRPSRGKAVAQNLFGAIQPMVWV